MSLPTILLPAVVLSCSPNPVLEFAKTELAYFWSASCDSEESRSIAIRFVFEIDPAMEQGSFSCISTPSPDGTKVEMKGADQTCVLHAVYTFLETLGYRFQITGPVAPAKLAFEKIPSLRLEIRPAVLDRGIRQHINFPMDLSSYSLDEAKEYIRNLARMRYNAISFHSYPNQWIETTRNDEREIAGSFFYGQRHDIPDVPLMKRGIRNKKTFCIPEIEPVFDNEQKRSEQSIAWLAAVMAESKRAGMKVGLSFEPRSRSLDTTETLATVKDILATYPLVDVLEFMTEETGGWGPSPSEEELRTALVTHFGAEATGNEVIAPLIGPGKADLHILVEQIGHNIRAVRDLLDSRRNKDGPKITLGVYCVLPEYLPAVAEILHRYAPQEAAFAILAGHGSERVARHMRVMDAQPADAARTTLYSWLEFDGIMYLQQNGVTGIRELIEVAERSNHGRQIPAILFNHWRTAENAVTARYASLATLFGPLDEVAFYTEFAMDLGIKDAESFARAMAVVDDADTVATEKLPNIGFSFVGCWVNGIGIGYFGNYDPEHIAEARGLYDQALALVVKTAVDPASPAGLDFLAFHENRLRATVIYLDAMEEAVKLKPLCKGKEPSELDAQDQAAVLAICDRALALFDKYMEMHAELMPDRGCEGTLVSVYYTPIAVLKKIRVWFGGLPEDALPATEKTKDAPVSPIQFST